MKPAPFRYFAPESLDDALALMKTHGDDAKLLSGGQSLIPTMNMRLAKPVVLIDLKRIPNLSAIEERDGMLHIGGLVTHADIELSDLVKAKCPLLQEAASHIGYPAVRNRGTIGGSLAHADPAATLSTVVSCLGGTLVATGPNGTREISAEEFFVGLFTTSLESDEILTEVRVPVTNGAGQGHSWLELNRHTGDFALVGVAAQVTITGGIIEKAAVVLTGVGLGPVVADQAAATLVGQKPTAELFTRAAQSAQMNVDAETDLHATAEYRQAMVQVMVERALAQACQRAQGGGTDGSH